VAFARLKARGGEPDRYERLGADFHARVRAGFRSIAEAETARCVVVDAGGSEAEVHERVLAVISDRVFRDL
jgi:dTMP kinase